MTEAEEAEHKKKEAEFRQYLKKDGNELIKSR
ncbi:Uncharacterised protein [Staphylococcus gallinarum]|uniref:Uncharacterized protein n=1 Tax=Staphylococcus gallinarum TaxID=1293 RepID=A0A380SAL3_STAGA|nr:Uncharacterised protein [Staphylococcus gallinarum]